MVEFVATLTGGLPITTVSGGYYTPQERIIIGPKNVGWRVQMLDEQLQKNDMANSEQQTPGQLPQPSRNRAK